MISAPRKTPERIRTHWILRDRYPGLSGAASREEWFHARSRETDSNEVTKKLW